MLTNHHDKGVGPADRTQEAKRLLEQIEDFVRGCARPAVLEMGDDPIALVEGEHAWEVRNGSVLFSAWPEQRSMNRRITAIEGRKPGLLVCRIQRFGAPDGRLNVLDLGHPKSAARLVTGERHTFSEAFRRMLSRQFPGWALRTFSTGLNMPHSFSPKFPRAILEHGKRRIAAMACPSVEDESQMLSFALLWHDYASGAENNRARVPLALFLPENAGNTTALRLKWLRVNVRLYRFNEHGSAGEVDSQDLGNMDTRVVPPSQTCITPELEAALKDLVGKYGLEAELRAEAGYALSCKGLEFAHARDGKVYCGLNPESRQSQSSLPELEALASSLSSIRRAAADDRAHPLYRSQPEKWLATEVRRDPGAIDAQLEGQPVWSQVITFAAADRDVIDLLSSSRGGRAVVIELKASEDIHLPLQALDYWMRAEWHVRAGDLDSFFPGTPVAKQSPKLLLVAPAVEFHPSNEVILTYFDAQIETERIGLNLEWQQGLKVAFRLKGSEKPQSQRRCQ